MIPISEPPLKASERPMSQIDEQANTAPFFTTLVFCPSAAVAAEGKTRVSSPSKKGSEREGETFRPGSRRQNAGNVVHCRVLTTKSLGEMAAIAPDCLFQRAASAVT